MESMLKMPPGVAGERIVRSVERRKATSKSYLLFLSRS